MSTPTTIERSVETALAADPEATRFGLHVVADATRQDDEWTYVVVQPSKPGIRAYDLVELLVRIEQRVRDTLRNPHVLVLPASGV